MIIEDFLKKEIFLYFSDVWQGATADPSIVFERKESTPPPPPPPICRKYTIFGGWQVYTHISTGPPSPLHYWSQTVTRPGRQDDRRR
jgi:hypothetical protein